MYFIYLCFRKTTSTNNCWIGGQHKKHGHFSPKLTTDGFVLFLQDYKLIREPWLHIKTSLFISLRYLDCGRCLGPWNIWEFLCSNNLFVWAGVLVNQVIFSTGTDNDPPNQRKSWGAICVRFNTPSVCSLHAMPARHSASDSHICAPGCNLPFPAVIFPKHSPIILPWQELK